MPHYDTLFPGRFMKNTQLEKPMEIRIVSMVGETLEGEDNKKEAKGILTYADKDGKQGEIVFCKTNCILTAAMYGDLYENWPGKLITIYRDPSVRVKGEVTGGIRVYGGPMLTEPKEVRIKRPRRKNPEIFVLRPTRKQPPAAPPAQPQPTAHD